MTKILLYILGGMVILGIGIAVFSKLTGRGFSPVGLNTTIKNVPKVNVSNLTEGEKKVGTIIYPGAKPISEGSSIYKVPDSVDAVINSYAIDLANRYKTTVNKKESQRSEALNNRAVTVSATADNKALSIVIWAGKDGFTYFEIGK